VRGHPIDVPVKRQRGSIRRRARCYEVRVSAGDDPSTGERIVLVESVDIEGYGERAERAAYREAEKVRTRLLNQVDEKRNPRTRATVNQLMDRYLELVKIGDTTRPTYEGYIRRHIRPLLGELPTARLGGEVLDSFFTELRTCRAHCCRRRVKTEPLSAGEN